MVEDKYKEYKGHTRFYELLDEIRNLYNAKNSQYATSKNTLGAFERSSVLMGKLFKDSITNKKLAVALAYMAKQIDAVYEMVGESKGNTVEKLEEKLKDIAVYALIAIILNDEPNK